MREKRITSVEIQNFPSGPGFAEDMISHKLGIYRSGKISHCLYNGLSEKPIEEYEYKVEAKKMESFFESLVSTIMIEKWRLDYRVMVCDGWSWACKIRYYDHTIKKVVGTVEPPPRGKQLQSLIYKLTDFKVQPWIL